MQERTCETMAAKVLNNIIHKKVTENFQFKDAEFEALGIQLKEKVDKVFGRSIAIRELDAGSDNATEIELNNLSTPYYDVERFGIGFVASPTLVVLFTGVR